MNPAEPAPKILIEDEEGFIRLDGLSIGSTINISPEVEKVLQEVIRRYNAHDGLVEKAETAESALVEIEWVQFGAGNAAWWACPCCFNEKAKSHTESCQVAKALALAKGPQ